MYRLNRMLDQVSGPADSTSPWVFTPKIQGANLDDEIISSIISFFFLFLMPFGVLSVLLSLCGLPFLTSLTAAWTAIANVGPAWGAPVGPKGAMDAFPTSAKWLMIADMIIGRLEVLSVYVLFIPKFWRA